LRLFVGLIVVVALASGAQAQPRTAPPAGFDDYVARVLKAFDVPGVSVAIVKDGRTVLAKGYGVRRLGAAAPVDAQRADAYITFALGPDGAVDQAKMIATSPAVDFSFDFQDLLLGRQLAP
jgi:hypothetical protein